jgi:inhibitor of cysteine peptidase
MSEIVILDSDQGKTFEVRAGDLIVIRLAENPTTGYRWEISGVDNQLVEVQGSDYLVAPGTGIGSGGTRTFHLRAKSTGRGQIQLKLRRSWEPEDKVVEQFTVNIRIQ